MTLITVVEKSQQTWITDGQVPVLVFDDAGASVSSSSAKTAAEAAAPSTLNGLAQTGIPAIDQLSGSAYRVTISYGLLPGLEGKALLQQRRSNGSAAAQPITTDWATPVARFPGTAFDLAGQILNGIGEVGAVIQPGPANHSVSLEMTAASFTAAYRGFIGRYATAGVVNNSLIDGFAAGTLQLVSVAWQQTSQTKMQVTFGYCHKANVTGETRGTVTGINYAGHDYPYNYLEPMISRTSNARGWKINSVHVVRPWPRVDFSTLSPSGYNVLPDAIA